MVEPAGLAAGVLAGAAVLCAATALVHLLLPRPERSATSSPWPFAWLLSALAAAGEMLGLAMGAAWARGLGGALLIAGVAAMGSAIEDPRNETKEDRSSRWWILGAAAALAVLVALLPSTDWRRVLGAAVLVMLGWLVRRVWEFVTWRGPRFLFFAGAVVLGSWALMNAVAPTASVVGAPLTTAVATLLLGLALLGGASVLAVVESEIGAFESKITDLEETQEHLLRMAESDPLTGCPSRQSLRGWFERWEGGEPVSVVLIDIGNLKRINDDHGYEAGDEALRLVAGVLKESIRPGDLVVRWGGDEFVVVLRGAGHEAAKRRFTSLLGTLEEAAEGFPYEAPLRVDWGVASCAAPSDISRALAEADERMYAMKRRRRREAGGKGS